MTNNNANVVNNAGESSEFKIFNKSDSNNIIPINWKKYGEVYCNKIEQPVFVCSICLENADNINSVFTTSDASAFWCHIQHQHISVDYETIDKISEEIQNFLTNGGETEVSIEENNSKMDETADMNIDTIKETKIQLLEEFHENLIKDNVVKETDDNEVFHSIDTGKDSQQTVISSMDRDDIKPNIKVDEMEQYVNKFSNCNYYYDNETCVISDDDDEEEDDDDGDEEELENNDILDTTEKPKETNYLKHNDMIEISDDEDDQDDVDTRPNSPISIDGKIGTNEVINRIEPDPSESDQINHFNIYERVRPHNIEGNNLSQSNTNRMHLINAIPTPDVSPCESLTNQHFYTNSNTQQYYKDPQSRRNHQGNILRRPYKCITCRARTKTEKNMKKHQILHHSPDIHLFTTDCDICNKKVLKTKLNRHLLYHSLRHKCDYCSIICKNKCFLKNHIKKYHPERNIYSVPPYPQQLDLNFNIPPAVYMQNNQQLRNESSLMSSMINSLSSNLSPAEEQQQRYRECEQIWQILESRNNITPLQNP